MLAIVLGFTAVGSQAPVEVLYAGRSASEAGDIADNPPPGILRTEMMKNPLTHHKRHFPGNVVVETEDGRQEEDKDLLTDSKNSKGKAK